MMIEMWKHFNIYDEEVIIQSCNGKFTLRNELDYQLFNANELYWKKL